MTSGIEAILVEALRAVFLIGLPTAAVIAAASLIISMLQSATTVSEPALGHAVRVLALIALGYVLAASFAETIVSLARNAWS